LSQACFYPPFFPPQGIPKKNASSTVVAPDHHLISLISVFQPSASFPISSKTPSAAKWCGNSQSGRALIPPTNDPTGVSKITAFEIIEGSLLAQRDIPVARHVIYQGAIHFHLSG
jgi:hypothetical protein